MANPILPEHPATILKREQQFQRVLALLGQKAVKDWNQTDEVGRVAMALAISGAIRKTLGDTQAEQAFRILFNEATR